MNLTRRQSHPSSTRSGHRSGGVLATLAVTCLLIAGCGSDSSDSATAGSSGSTGPAGTDAASTTVTESNYPFTVSSCGFTATFNEPPQRVITYEANALYTLVELGLGDRIVWAGVGDDVPAELKTEIAKIQTLNTNDGYGPSREEFRALQPDLHIATQAEYEFSDPNASKADHEEVGTQVFAYSNGCLQTEANDAGLDGPDGAYQQLRTIGRIFDISDRVESEIARMQTNIEEVHQAVSGAPEVKVGWVYASDDFSYVGLSARGIYGALITAAGGTNVWADKTENFADSSVEELASRPVDVFVVGDQEIADRLFDKFPDFPASKNRRAVIVQGAEGGYTGLHYDEVVQRMAATFYPDLVKP